MVAPQPRRSPRLRRSQRPASHLEDLPGELVVRVLAGLPDAASLASLGATCKALRAVATQHTTGARGAFTDASFAACLRSLPALRRLEIRMLSPLWDTSPLASQRHLTRLAAPEAPAFQSPDALRHIPPSVLELDLCGAALTCRAFARLPLGRLRSLDLRNTALPAEDDLTPHLAACTSLQVLRLCCHMRDAAPLWAALAGLPALRELALTHAAFSAAAPPACPARLQALSLAHSHVAELSLLLPDARQLSSLCLDTVLTPAGAWAAELPALRELTLAGPVTSACGLRTPPLARLWLRPAAGSLALRDLPASLAGLSSLALVGVRACSLDAAAALARLPLRRLLLARCGGQLQARLLARGGLPQLQCLALAHSRGELPRAPPPAPRPALRLLLCRKEQVLAGTHAAPPGWKARPAARALSAELAAFAELPGGWLAFSRDGSDPGRPLADEAPGRFQFVVSP